MTDTNPRLYAADPQKGLTARQAKDRLEQGLDNRIRERSGHSVGTILRKNCLTYFNLVFVIMAVVMLLVGSSLLNLTFMGVVVVNTAIGCVQELRAKRAVDKLTLVAAQKLRTVRDGEVSLIRDDLLVRDDIVEFTPGDQICADGILRTGSLHVNEALITGEADLIPKKPGDLLRSGSFVIAGRGRAQLTHVGRDAYAARLSAQAKADPRAAKSEMMRALDKLIKFIGFALIPVAAALFCHQFFALGDSLRDSVESTVAALVGMIPEGLYLLTSVALAVSALKLTRKRVLVQDMNCIETLARVDVLCVDKTGTITEPVMELSNVIPLTNGDPELLEGILNALFGDREWDNDTARAIAELFPGPSGWQCDRFIPFTSQTKWCAGVYSGKGTYLAGAPECVMGAAYDLIRENVEHWTHCGHRVLLVARYEGALAEQPDPELVTPLALLALTNRIRPQAEETFRYFARQGVTVKVISGDNPVTVSEVARRAGIANAERWTDMSALTEPADIRRAALEHTVFGRVTPEQKKLLIQALKEQGHTVAMTGDGVNDVLAMKEADCGIAMAGGAQAASQVAHLVLLDSDFSAMPGIVGEGRRVINNIQRAASLFLVKNIFSLGLALLTLITGLQFPLESFHLSIVSALTIGIPGFFLAMEPNYSRVTGKFLSNALRKALPGGLSNIAVVILAQIFIEALALPEVDGQTITTAILLCVGMLVLYRVCIPMSRLRRWVWGAMAVCAVGAFFVLPRITGHLLLTRAYGTLVLCAALLMAPTVFFIINYLFDRADRLLRRSR